MSKEGRRLIFGTAIVTALGLAGCRAEGENKQKVNITPLNSQLVYLGTDLTTPEGQVNALSDGLKKLERAGCDVKNITPFIYNNGYSAYNRGFFVICEQEGLLGGRFNSNNIESGK